jgi:hypothetical protein
MNANRNQGGMETENEFFHVGGKTSNFVIVPASIQHKHIRLEEIDKPVAALIYNNYTYSLFRTSNTWSEVEKLTGRLSGAYVITVISKGWAIWVFEY